MAWCCFEGRPGKLAGLLWAVVAVLWGCLLVYRFGGWADLQPPWAANPFGNWDAWSIWNLHARFLAAGGEFASRAWSSMPEAHPEYPLLVSAFVARCWAFGNTTSIAVPIATSYLFLLALVAMATGGMALLRSQSLGLLLGLGLLGTPTLLHEVPSQYADIPLACYLAGALVFLLLNRPILAGVLASM